ncbi:MAG: PAS domain S-box protein [Phycisphaerales bacterium]|nr:PAS domain S-box protein [Phycisphaerales bacterium]
MDPTLKVLLIHPEPGGVWDCIRGAFGEHGHGRARSIEEAAEHPGAIDAVLLEFGRDRERGTKAVRGVRRMAPAAVLIVLVGPDDDEGALAAVREGAHDCLIAEGLEPRALQRAVLCAVERAKAERELRDREEFTRRVIENMPGGLLRVDLDGSITLANEQAQRFFGIRPDGRTTHNLRDFRKGTVTDDGGPLAPDDMPVTRAMRTGRPVGPRTLGIKREDGSVVWGVFAATPLLGADGNSTGAVVTFMDVTERRAAEQALRESEERFRTMADSAPMLVWMTDAEGNETYYNRTWQSYTGESLERALQHGWRRCVHPDDIARCLEVFEGARRGRSGLRLEYRLRRADGSYGWVLSQGSPRFSPDGAYTGHIGSCADITDRKKAEDSLIASEATQRALLEAIPDLLFRMDRQGTYLDYIGPKGATLLAPPRGFLGKRAADVLGERHAELLLGVIDRALSTQAVSTYEYTAGTEEAPRYHEVRVVPCGKDEVLAVVRNITARKRTEAALRESEERYRGLVETSPDGIIVHQENRIVLANDRMARLMGVEHGSDLIGLAPIELVYPEDRPLVLSRQAHVHETGEPVPPMIERLLGRGGHVVWAEVAASPCIHDGRAAVQVVVRDIADRRRMEEDLRRAQKLQAVGQLASGVAHDFNNLLTAIFGFTSLARRTLGVSHPAHRSLERVEEAARQASGVTKALLTFSRSSPGEKRPVPLADAVHEAVRLLRRTLPPGVRLETSLDLPEPVWVDADATQLQQVVLNLAINARDAMPQGGRLTIALEPGGPELRRTVRLVVADTGVGMAPEVEARIFDPFFTTKPPDQGTGLGLPIVHGIVKDHHGTISVRTVPGKGSTFTVELPCVPPPGLAPTEPRASEVPMGRGETVLLVEDHAYVRELIASMLAASGYAVIQAASGEAMMEALASGSRPRLLILDRGLPDGCGWSWIERARGVLGPIPAVMLVGLARDEEMPPAGDATIILRKPFQLPDLMAAVVRGLGREGSLGGPT